MVKIIRKSWQVKSITSVFGINVVGNLMNDPFYLFLI